MNSASKHSKKTSDSYAEQLHTLLHNIKTQVWYLSDNHTYGMVNKAHAEFNGKNKEDLAFSGIPEEILLPWQQIFKIAFSSNKTIHTEELVQNSSGEHRLLAITLSPGLQKDGSVEFVVCSAEDITERKQAEDALRIAEEKFRAMYDNAPLPYQSLDCDGFLLDVNPKWLKTLGYLRGEILGKSFADFLHPDSKDQFKARFTSFKKQGFLNNIEFKIRHKNGNYLDISFEGCIGNNTDGSFKQTYCVFQDITEKTIAEKAYRKSQDLLRNIFESSTNLYYSHTPDHIITYMSPQVKEMLGYTPEEIKVIWMKLASDNPINEIGFENTVRAIETGEPQPPYELELVRKDGKNIWVEVRVFPEVVNGKTIAMLGSLTEITERKRAEESVRESEEKFRTIFENNGTATGLLGKDEIIQNCNAKFAEFTGYHRSEIIGRMGWTDFVASEDLARFQKYHSERTKKGSSPPAQYECRLVTKNKNVFDVLVNVAVNKKTRIVSLVDITDLKKANQEIQRMQRLEGLGTIAGGIAHDFNNLLMGFQGNLSLMLLDVDPKHPHYDYLINMEDYVKRGSELTRQILGFARGGKYEVKSTDLNELLEKSSEMFSRTKKEILIHKKYQNDLWPVEVDRGQI
ncbi:MAG: PAS domain S-box protein, partial [Candidatus Sabulitectum sp.]|nr:PAS domain S-box protein [Candidatus Sabulitectum sp.]